MSRRRNAVACAAFGLLMGCATARTEHHVESVPASIARTQVVMLPAGASLAPTNVTIPIPSAYSRVTASRLVSRPELSFKRVEQRWESYRVTFLMLEVPGTEPSPLAALSSFQVGSTTHVWLQRLTQAGPGIDSSDVEIATIEHLYGLALAQDPAAAFCLSGFGQRCDRVDGDYSQAELLRRLHEARERAATHGHRAAADVRWSVVYIEASPRNSGDDDHVAARVIGDQGPIEGATVFFHRAPHSDCSARSSLDGIAACNLVDQHGDEHQDLDHGKVPVLATYPGDVQPNRVLLPTTLIMGPTP